MIQSTESTVSPTPGTGNAIFDPETCTFTLETPKGTFYNVCSAGGFDNYRQMDIDMWDLFESEIEAYGMLAYLNESPREMYLFYYPKHVGGGVITVYCSNIPE